MKISNITISIKHISAGIILLIAIYVFSNTYKDHNVNYDTALVTRGDIQSIVNTTGTIEPRVSADIIPHVSGIIKDVYADYNSPVKEGDVLAVLQEEQFELDLKQAQANYSKASADLEYTRDIYESNKKLFKKNLISRQELNNSEVNYSSSLALYEQAYVTLEKAKTDLKNTRIVSPIDGIVIGKNIIVGQSVSDRLDQQPVFTVVDNLTDMNIVAPVNEVDIGKLKEGNTVTFIADAFPDHKYDGKIMQIVSQPVTYNNIVTYDIIVRFENRDSLLKPGMTASIEVLADSRSDVLVIPKTALRFTPRANKEISKDYDLSAGNKIIWILSANNDLKAVKIKTGLSNATIVEIKEGNINLNDVVIIGYKNNSGTDSNGVGPIRIPGVKRF